MLKRISYLHGIILVVSILLSNQTAFAKSIDLDTVAAKKPTPIEKDWSVEVGSGIAFSNVRCDNLDGYTYVPTNVTASLKIDDVSLDNFCCGIFRGYTEFFFSGYWNQNVNGPSGENHMVGMSFGPRYNFVQPDWPIIPFIQAGVGFGFADSNPTHGPGGMYDNAHGIGQDFSFTFSVAAGFRYDIDDTYFLRIEAFYQHFSNAGLSEPEHSNRAIDAVGPQLSFGVHF